LSSERSRPQPSLSGGHLRALTEYIDTDITGDTPEAVAAQIRATAAPPCAGIPPRWVPASTLTTRRLCAEPWTGG